MQVFPDLVPVYSVLTQFLHGVQSLFNRFLVDQGLFDHLVELSRAHCGAGLVEDPEEGSPLFLLTQCLSKLEVSSRRAVEKHVFALCVDADPGNI